MNGKHPIALLHEEINRLRKRDGEEPIGGLALARKVFRHLDEEHNPRVAEALANLKMGLAKPRPAVPARGIGPAARTAEPVSES